MDRSKTNFRLKSGYHFQNTFARGFFIALDFFGNLLIHPFLKKNLKDKKTPRKILLCKNDHLGDLVLFLSILPKIKEVFKNDELHLAVGSWAKELIRNNPYIDNVLYYDSFILTRNKSMIARITHTVSSTIDFIFRAIRNRYDIAIDFRAYFPNMIPVLFLSNVTYKTGFASGGFGFLLNSVQKWEENTAETEQFLNLIKPFGNFTHEGIPADLPQENDHGFKGKVKHAGLTYYAKINRNNLEYLCDMTKTEKLMQYYHIDKNVRFVIVHPFGGHKTKYLKKETWEKVIRNFKKLKFNVVLVGQARVNPFLQLIDNQTIFDLINKTEINTLAGLIKKAEFLAGMDSFPAQLSIAMNKRTIVFMSGVESKQVWYTKSDNLLVLGNEVECSPCYKKAGCKEMKCLDMDTDKVIENINTFTRN